MCGIAGWWNPNGLETEDAQHLNSAAVIEPLRHRGPSNQHHILLQQPDGLTYAMLGTARLSIVGLEDGQQPVSSPCGRWRVSMNGEIYNHAALRRECIGNGFTPHNTSDTAVVAALLSFLPFEQVIDRLRGMFAFAIVDTQSQCLYLLRDRGGQKPLYWTQLQNGTLLWSSELRVIESFFRKTGRTLTLNQTAVSHFLCFEYIPAPLSIWQGIQKLQPAHRLTMRREQLVAPTPYWTFPTQTLETASSRLHWEKSLYFALRSATQLRAQADVEVGTLLSGGIDSTTITALAAELHPQIRSFSLAVEAPGFSERQAIEENIRHLQHRSKIQSTCYTFGEKDFLPTVENVWTHMDEPLADSSLIVTWFLFAQIQREGIRCVLSGDGADELFAGYPTHLAALAMMKTQSLPHVGLRALLQPLVQKIPANTKGVSWEEMLKRFCSVNVRREQPWWQEQQLWMGAWLPNELRNNDGLWDIAEFWAKQTQSNRVGDALFLDQRLYLAEGVLTKVDRASMAHGIEVRSPFMDHAIVELVSNIPLHLKLNRHGNKQILRGLLPTLPKKIQHRTKKGFGSPVALWMDRFLADQLTQVPTSIEPWIALEHLQLIQEAHTQGVQNHRRRLWTALQLSAWLERHPPTG